MKVHGTIFCPKAFFQITDAPAILRNAIFLDDEFDALEYALYKWQRNITGCYAGGELLSTKKLVPSMDSKCGEKDTVEFLQQL